MAEKKQLSWDWNIDADTVAEINSLTNIPINNLKKFVDGVLVNSSDINDNFTIVQTAFNSAIFLAHDTTIQWIDDYIVNQDHIYLDNILEEIKTT